MNAGAMEEVRLSVIHETTYEYATRVELAHHLAYLQPVELPYQRLDSFALVIAPEPSHRSAGIDVFGNARELFSFYMNHDELRVLARSEVLVLPRPGAAALLAGRTTGMPWETVRDALRYRAGAPYVPAAEFVFPSSFVPLHAEIGAWAAASFGAERTLLDGAIDLMHRIHAEFEYSSDSTDVSTPVLEAFDLRAGVCQDFAHVMISGLRTLGLAARYVSGYLLTQPPPGKARLIGADASHAWVQLWCPLNGWVDLDPTNDLIPGTSHVTLAIGRDYGDVAPLRGVIRGGGRHTLTVGVTVAPTGELDATAIAD